MFRDLWVESLYWVNSGRRTGKEATSSLSTLGMRDLCLPGLREAQPCPQAGGWVKSLGKSPSVPVVEPPPSFLGFGKVETSKIKMTLKELSQLALS